MSSTSLVQKFGLQAVAGEYAGAETVLRFGSVAEELDALRHGCGVFDLGWRGKLVVSGEDRVRWLNGMVTQQHARSGAGFRQLQLCAERAGTHSGRSAGLPARRVLRAGKRAGQIATIREFFERFIIMDDVEIGDISTKLTSIGVAGPRGAAGAAQRAGCCRRAAKPGELLDGSWDGHGFSLVRDPIEVRNWYELWLAPEQR